MAKYDHRSGSAKEDDPKGVESTPELNTAQTEVTLTTFLKKIWS